LAISYIPSESTNSHITQFGSLRTTTQLALPFGFFVGSDGRAHDSNGFIVGTVNDFLVPVDGFFGEPTSGGIDFEGSTGPAIAGSGAAPLCL
jgi:hypothetical protein